MPRSHLPPRVRKWRGSWYLFYFDHRSGRNLRRSCFELGATNAQGREELVKRFRLNAAVDSVEVVRRGGRFDFEHPLLHALGLFRESVHERVRTREANPDAREGLAPASGRNLTDTLDRFEDWLRAQRKAELTTGQLDVQLLRRFVQHLATTPTRNGNKEVMRSAATLNRHKRNLRTTLNYLAELQPPVFPNPAPFSKALRGTPPNEKPPDAFSAKELQRFLITALERESPDRKVRVLRLRKGRRETFEQAFASQAATAPSRLFLLLALTGTRLGEALGLKWEDVNLERGWITIHAGKTGRTRIVPLTGAAEGEVAPTFLKLLRRWHEESPDAKYVLPHVDLPKPTFPKHGWENTLEMAKLRRIGPQMLRSNFTSYAASIGIPASIATLWQGHGERVATKYYRTQVLERNAGTSIEAAMGLAEIIQGLLDEQG